jgi:hypothetical protein
MQRAEFWAMIEAAKPACGGDGQPHTAQLVAALGALPASEILDYRRIQDELLAESYSWDLWGAAHLLGGGGCGDDGFDYFRGWLLAQGQATWQAACRDPDWLAEHPQVRALPLQRRWWGGWFACQDMLYVAHDAYRQRTGADLPLGDLPGPRRPATPGGERWDPDDDEQLRRRYPRLFAWLHAAAPPGPA